jgi:XTP/dITP diphosphohydrolase
MGDASMMNVVIASDNKGKVLEIQSYLEELAIRLVPQSTFSVPAIAETGLSFVENALIKARNAAKHTNLPALADDSGLTVNVLKGEPGIYSARYAGMTASDDDNIQKLLNTMASIPEGHREASFYCALAFVRHARDPVPIICLGQWQGTLLTQRRGGQGFGYDPIFYVPETHCSAAELSLTQKNQLSHRAKALQQLVPLLAAHLPNEHTP